MPGNTSTVGALPLPAALAQQLEDRPGHRVDAMSPLLNQRDPPPRRRQPRSPAAPAAISIADRLA